MDKFRFKYVHTTIDHINHIAENMREADRIEVMASHGHTPLEAMMLGYENSDQIFTALGEDDEPVFVLGVVLNSLLSDIGTVWLLGCDDALKYGRNFIAEAPEVLSILLERYTLLENYVHVKIESTAYNDEDEKAQLPLRS